ncbi:FtsW/RodA/SpoVE family cell cycle protein [bacterium]|nr:FtsW/RodA/SpoVE family cell cycle protein [bacterium]
MPEAQSDFVFAAFSEEIGFLGNMILLGLYIFIFRYSLKHIQSLKDYHSKMLGIGILSILMIQTFVHIGVNIQIIPNTGVTLPFVSS